MSLSFINLIYFIASLLFIIGLKNMSSPRSARKGIILASYGMLAATLITFFNPEMHGVMNYLLIMVAIILGSVLAWYYGKRVAMTDMPQMIAIFNGMGGGAAGAIAAVELLQKGAVSPFILNLLALIGALIGWVSFSGSIIAFCKLQGLIDRIISFPGQQRVNLLLLIASVILGLLLLSYPHSTGLLFLYFALILILGINITLPIGGANMPVVISLFNAMTGLAVGFEGFVLDNDAMIIAGTVVGASGTLLTKLMAKAMNQSIVRILFTAHTTPHASQDNSQAGTLKEIETNDAAILLNYAKNVIIAPGYGMAVAQAQHKLWELVQLLEKQGVQIKFAIHPVAGRMPGHMNVLLAEAGVTYDKIFDLEEINAEFSQADVAIVIGANDVVNPAAKTNPNSPIYGMPILNVDAAKNVLVIKRGQGKGFAGIENSLFYQDNTQMLYGDGQEVLNKLVQALKNL